MTAHPIPENSGCWWLTCGKWRRLHAVFGPLITSQQMRDAIDAGLPLRRPSVCGMTRGWSMPGLFSRLGLRRCAACCQLLSISAGCGTPVNEASRKEPTT